MDFGPCHIPFFRRLLAQMLLEYALPVRPLRLGHAGVEFISILEIALLLSAQSKS
jgi:hypothetical protein